MIKEGVIFALPSKCPVVTSPVCSMLEIEQGMNVVDALEAPSAEDESAVRKKKGRKNSILVESEVRRSPRVKKDKKGFKDPVCTDKNCIGCNSKPPTLSSKAIRNLSSSLCDVDVSMVSDEALNKLKSKGAIKRSNSKEVKSKKTKKKVVSVTDDLPKPEDDKINEDEV